MNYRALLSCAIAVLTLAREAGAQPVPPPVDPNREGDLRSRYSGAASQRTVTRTELARKLQPALGQKALNCESDELLKRANGARLARDLDVYCGFPDGFTAAYVNASSRADVKLGARTNGKPCAALDGASANDPEPLTVLKDVCNKSTPTALPAGVETVLVAAVSGLGDFLRERAKEELIAYAVQILGREACQKDGAVRAFFGDAFPFPKSCAIALPDDGTDLDYQAFADGRFQRAFANDVAELPAALADAALAKLWAAHDDFQPNPNQKLVFAAVLRVLVTELTPLCEGRTLGVERFVTDLDALVKQRLAEGHATTDLKCAAGPGGAGFGPECALLLGLRLGATVETAPKDVLDEMKLVGEATKSFCADYAGVDNCLALDPPALENAFAKVVEANPRALALALSSASTAKNVDLAQDLIALVTAYRDAYEAVRAASALGDPEKKIAGVLSGLRQAIVPTLKFANRRGVVDKKYVGIVTEAMEALGDAVDAGFALAKGDMAGGIVALKAVIAIPTIKKILHPEGVRAVNFMLSLGAAKDSASAKQVIDDAAEPLGSYRAKYDSSFVVSLNGFVGPFVKEDLLLNAASPPPGRFAPAPLAGIVGLDFSWRAASQHVGFTLAALDAFGMVTIEDKTKPRIDWGGVLTPGLLFRWGVCRSPLVVFAGGEYQPLRQSDSSDPTAITYKGILTAGGGVAVDIPIFMLRAK